MPGNGDGMESETEEGKESKSYVDELMITESNWGFNFFGGP